ncbi:MAG: hypothetical protein P8129_06750 [Anaerolineae bacterium]|jgi:hypothetical protein
MRIRENLGLVLLAIWLIIRGLVALISLSFTGLSVLLAILAIVAGLLLLLSLRNNRFSEPRTLGLLLLAIWLALTGLLTFASLEAGWMDVVMAVLAIAAGVLLFLAIVRVDPMAELGLLLAAIWLLLTGLISLVSLGFSGLSIVMGLLALIAGILLLVRR